MACADCGRENVPLITVTRIRPHVHEVTACADFGECLRHRDEAPTPMWRCAHCWALVPETDPTCRWCGRDEMVPAKRPS